MFPVVSTRYYIRNEDDVYVCWKDNSCVCVMSNEYPGHSEGTIKRRARDRYGVFQALDLPLPTTIKHYNRFIRGVDMPDQLISYHRILRQTKTYWRTLYYHLLEIAITNASIIHKWLQMEAGKKAPTSGTFRDAVVLANIEKFGTTAGHGSIAIDFPVKHGSIATADERRKCVVCHSHSGRQCPDCPFCANQGRRIAMVWHSTAYTVT